MLLERYIDYNRLYIFSNSLNQPEYKLVIEGFKKRLSPQVISFIFKDQDNLERDDYKELVDEAVKASEHEHPGGSWKSPRDIFHFLILMIYLQ